MKNKLTLSYCCNLFAIALMLLSTFALNAQTTIFQNVATQCWNGPTQSYMNTTGTNVASLNFVSGVHIPAGHRVVDVIVEIVWSKTDDGSCTAITGNPAELEHVGFKISGPVGGSRYLAASQATAPFALPATTASFVGSFPAASPGVIRDTIVFRDGYPSLLPAGLPNFPQRDTVSPNNDPLSFYTGISPYGLWSVAAIDDLPAISSPQLCIHSFCITLVTCLTPSLSAVCLGAPSVALNATGTHLFQFADLDNGSDISCITKDISFSPAFVNCSNIGTPVAVTMTLTDQLDSVASCVSMVNVVDNTPPTIVSSCSPSIFGNIYLGPNGRDTFYADSVVITDNCGLVTKKVRALAPGSPYTDFRAFNCITGFQQFWVRGVDAQGNMDSCRIVVNIIDTFPPTAICGRDTINVGAGPVTVAATDVDNGSFDVCPPVTGWWLNVHLGPSPTYSCADLGQDTVLLIVSDASGNLDTCNNAIITIQDNTPPTATCQPANVYLNAAGTGTLLPTAINNGSLDICGVDSIDVNGVASLAYNCSHVGTPQNVTLNVFDASDNTASCVAVVTVLDTFPPTAICQNRTIYVNSAGNASLLASALNGGSTDVCTGTTLSFSINGSVTANFTCAHIATNPNPVTLTVFDDYGNDATCTANVTVLDTIRPTANCTTPTVYLNNIGVATVTATQLNNSLSTDNCGVNNLSVNVVGVTSTNYTCAAIFTPQPATLIVRDASGNSSNCPTTVNVVDTVAPTPHCEAFYTATLNAAGLATVTPANIDSSSTDNCNIVQYLINGASSRTYNCADIGTSVAVLTVRDSSGNTRTCNTTITVVDNTPPTAACQVANVYLSGGGSVSITPATVLAFPATADNCGTINTSFQGGASNILYDCDSLGTRTVRVVVTDASGNTATCQTTVDVLDTIPPTANCRPVPYTVSLNAAGVGFVVPANVNQGSTDNCLPIASMLVNGVDTFFYNCSSIGNSAVTLSVLDASGNQSDCVAQVVVADPTPPVALCHDTTLYIGASGVVTAFPANINNGSSDNCSFTMAINNLPSVNYSCNQVGINTAQLIITDGAGNSTQCSANITVRDTIRPVAVCIAPATLNVYVNSSCFATVPASTFNGGSTDNCASTLSYRVGGLPNVTFTVLGLNNITLTVRDGSNNTATCNTSVIVRDSIRPTMICRIDTVELDATGNTFIVPNNVNGGSFDNCGVPTYTVNGGPVVNYTCANIGVNAVTLRGTDASGNFNTCNTTVLVRDLIAPNAACQATATVNLSAVTSTGTLAVGQVDNFSSDNCTITSYVLSQTLFDCSHIAGNPHTITMTITDQSGNQDSCTTEVTVVDPVPPVANCNSPINLVLAGPSVSTSVAAVNNNSVDNCGIASMTLSQTTFTCANVGANNVTLTVTDGSGNVSTCASTINVADNTDPVALCNPATVLLNAAGTGSIAATALATSSFDACGISLMLGNGLDTVTFACANLGANNVTVYMEDPSGNSASCVATVTVEDNIPPTADCITTPHQLFLNAAGTGIIGFANINLNSTDNCSIASFSLSKSNYNCSDIVNNPNNVTLTVTDVDGNISTCVGQVMVRDTIRPAMVCQPRTVYLNASCNATINASIFNGGSSDACTISGYTFTGAPTFLTAAQLPLSPIAITLTGTDVNGNFNTCNTTLTVLDTIDPVLTCNNINIVLNTSGAATVNSSTPGLFTMSDACSTPTITLNGGATVNYTCANLGSGNNITLVATDGSGNSSTCNSTITVQDTTDPDANCIGSITLYLNAGGTGSITPAMVNSGSTDNCTVVSTTLSLSNFNCSHVATSPNIVTLTATDQSGNTNTCTTPVNVLDTIRPTMFCQPRTVYLNAAGTATIAASIFNSGSTDACNMAGFTFTGAPTSLNCSHVGVRPIVLTGTDVNGNSNTCNTTLTVLDTFAPVLTCNNISVSLSVTGPGAVTVNSSTPGLFTAADGCGITSVTLNGGAAVNYTCANLGGNNVTLVVSDATGNSSTCNSTVTVQDNTNPTATCVGSFNLYLNSVGAGSITTANINAGSTDNCTVSSLSLSQTNFDCSHVATSPNTVILTVTDQSGNDSTCNASVNVLDTIDPTMFCQARTIFLNAAGSGTVTAGIFNNNSVDACGGLTFTFTGVPSSINCAHLGIQNIVLTGTDVNGNSATCNTTLTVLDTIDPALTCSPITISLSAAGTATINSSTIGLYTTSDACGVPTLTLNGGPAVNFTCAHLGSNNVTLVSTDGSGNTSTCATTVTVQDVIQPTVTCFGGPIPLFLDTAGVATLTPAAVATFSDNCTIVSTILSKTNFNCNDINTNPNSVTLSVTDQSGNISTCNTTINAIDTVPPKMRCKTDTVYLNLVGASTITTAMFDNGSGDACGIASLVFTGIGNSVSCADVGIHNIVLTGTDLYGNVSSCTAVLEVEDTVAPVLNCNNITVNLSAAGTATITGTTPGLSSMSDACGGLNLTLNGGLSVNYTCANVGLNNVTLVAVDTNGNSSTCVSVVTIQDVTAPVITCSSATLYLPASGTILINPTSITGSVMEACGVATVSTNPASLDCSDVSPFNTVTLTVTDVNGNSSSCNGNIALLDTIKPNMVCRDTTVCLSSQFVNVNPGAINGGTTDACGMSLIQTINGFNNITYTCSDLGNHTVVLQMQDVNGNIDTCHAVVTVEDCLAPIALCNSPYTAYLAANGLVTVPAIEIDNASNDDCGIDSTTFRINNQLSVQYSCNHVGIPQNVVLSVSDFQGNISTCNAVINVVDTVTPIARCKTTPINAVLSATTGQFSVLAFTLNATSPSPTSSDNCSIATYLINGQARDTFDCSMVGLQMAVLTVVDNSGNIDTCHAPVNVRDLTSPSVTCLAAPINRVLAANGHVLVPVSALIQSATDICGIASILNNGQDTLDFDCGDIGNNIISVQVSDPSGNVTTCPATVSISDNLPPVANCHDTLEVFLTAASNVVVPAIAFDNGSTDNCGIVTWLVNNANSVTYNCTHIGAIPLPVATLLLRDSTGNQSTCISRVIVRDSVAPNAICSTSVTVSIGSSGVSTVTPGMINNGSNDNCSANLTYLINGQGSYILTCADIGTVTATLSVTDVNGNTGTCTSTLTVIDAIQPTIACAGTIQNLYLDPTGQVIVFPQPPLFTTVTDNCPLSNLTYFINGQASDTFDCSNIGSTFTVAIRVQDQSGNIGQCSPFISVLDTIPPSVSCVNYTAALDPNGDVTVFASDLLYQGTPFDNCNISDTSIVTLGQDFAQYNCNDVGSFTVVLYLRDEGGLVDTCHSIVTVQDVTPPTALCYDTITIALDATGSVTVPAIAIDSASVDACNIVSRLINGQQSVNYGCSNVGNNLAILQVTDANGLAQTCFTVISVQDLTPPTVSCQNVTAYLNASGTVAVSASALNNGSFDNCSALSPITFSNGDPTITYTCGTVDTHTVTLFVSDLYGNLDSCTASIIVRDTTPPTVNCISGLQVDLNNVASIPLVIGGGAGTLNVGSRSDICGIDTSFVSPSIITCADYTSLEYVVYTITATDDNGNSNTCQDTVRLNLSLPIITVPTQDTVLCEGEVLPLRAIKPAGNGFPYDYAWLGPNGQITFNPVTQDTMVPNVGIAQEGDYVFRMTRTNGVGCPSYDTVHLDVNEVQPPVLTGVQPCFGDSTVLYLANTASYIGSSINYTWYHNGVQIPGNNFDSLVIPNMTTADSGSYSMAITVIQAPTVCSDSSASLFVFDFLDLPTAPVPTANLPCEGDTLELSNNVNLPGFTYNWSGPASFSTTIADPTRANSTQAYAGTYTLTITDANDCSNTGTVDVVVSTTPPQPNMIYTQPLCVNDLLELSDTMTYAFAPVLYFWESPSGTIDTTSVNQLLLSNAAAGDYTLTVSMNGCLSIMPDTQTVVYEIIPNGADDFFSIPFRDSLTSATVGGNNIVNNDNPNASGFILTVIDSTNGGRVQINANGTLNYYPRSGYFGTDTLLYGLCDPLCPNSCDTIQVLIEVVVDFECFIPQGISPNGDGINDEVVVRCRHNYPNANIQIFSRWGTLVYEGNPTGWRGTFNGQDLPDGTYFYVLKLNDTTYTGTGSDANAGRVGDQYTGYIMIQR